MELYEKLDNLYQRINNGNNHNAEDTAEMYCIMTMLAHLGDHDIFDRYMLCDEVDYGVLGTEALRRDRINNCCQRYFLGINDKILEILNNNLCSMANYSIDEQILTEGECIKQIKEFYKNIGSYEHSLMNKMIDDERLIIINDHNFTNHAPEGNFFPIRDNNFAIVKYNSDSDLVTALTAVTIAHELAHPICISNGTIVDALEGPFRELIPITMHNIFLKTRKDYKYEYAKVARRFMYSLSMCGYGINHGGNTKSINESYMYAIGHYFGLYLSRLYITDKKKYKYLYDEIKKYIYTNNELKIFDLLLQEKEIKTGEFLKREIEENQKVLIKK